MSEPVPDRPPRNVFAIWRWRRRSLALALPIVIVIYVVSAVPVCFAAHKMFNNRTLQMVVCLPFMPVYLGANHSSSLGAFMQWEFTTMAEWFGPL
jgi:hypothetical protein